MYIGKRYVGKDWSPLKIALMYCNFKAAEKLVESGAVVNTELLFDMISSQHRSIKFVLSKGIGIQEKFLGKTPLCYSLYRGHVESMIVLRKNGAQLETNNLLKISS